MKRNTLVLGVVAVLMLMAIGYAAFSSQLTITGGANITSTWNVGFDTSQTSAYTPTTGISGGTAPTGSISFPNEQSATLTANLTQPGDSVEFTLTIENNGTIAAQLGTPSLQGSNCTVSGLTCTTTSGHIRFTVSNPVSTNLPASTGTTTMTVTAEFPNVSVSNSTPETAGITVNLNATQA